MTITLRRTKGTALTFDELDNNFSTLDNRTNSLNSLVSASLQGTTTAIAGEGILLQPSVDATSSSATIKLSKFLDATGQAAETATQYDVLTNVDLTATTASAGTTGIAYDSSTKTITYTPPDLTSFLTSSSSIDLSTQTLTGTLPSARLPNISLTSVTTVASEAAQLALTTEEGDVVIRSDENKSYIRNSGTADPHDMTNFSLLATPDTDTTYGISIEQTDSTDTDPTLNLTPNQGSADTITIKGGGATTVTRTDSGESVTINTPAAPVTSVDGNTGAVTTLQLGTTSTTALAGDTALLQLGTTSTTALAGDTTFAFADITSKPTTIAGYGITDALQLGTTSTTALAGDTALLQLGTTSTTALAGDTTFAFSDITSKPTTISGYGITDALELGTTSTTAMAGDTTFAFADITSKPTTISGYGITDALVIGTTSTTAMAGDTTFAFADITSKPTTISGYGITDALEIGTSSTTAMAGDTTFAFADITSKPTTISGYGITDALEIGTSSTTAMAGNTTFAFADITSKPTTISGYGITDALVIGTTATTAMAGNTALSAIGGSLDLSSQVTGTLPVGNMAATALTTVQTAANQAAQLALTTQEGDVVVRTDENKTYMRNSGTADPHDMTNFTLLATPTDAVTSVDGNTGAVTTLQIGTTATTAMAGNTTFAFADITSKPTTISGYGITDALEIGTSSTTAMAGDTTFAFSDITSKPTTISGYGITDALALGTTSTTALAGDTTFAFADITSKPTTISGYGITDALEIGTSSTTAMAGDTTFAFADITSKPTTISGYGITDALQLGTTSTTALAGNTTSFGGSASPINLGTHSGTGTQTINIGGAVIGGASTNIKNIYIGNGANNGGATNVFIGPSSTTTTAQTTIYHGVDFEYGTISFNGYNFTVDPSSNTSTITLGKTTGTGTITIGRSTGTQTIDIASASSAGSKISTVNIAQGGGTRTVNIASDSQTGSTTVVYAGNPSGTASSTILLRGNLSIDRPMYGNGAPEYYDFFDHLGGITSTGSDGDWDISGTGLNALTEITIPATSHIGTLGKRGSLRMTCHSIFYNSSSTTKRNAEYYLGLQMKSKGASNQSENLGAATLVSSPSQFNGVWSFVGNVTGKIVAGFGALANSNSASGMYYGPAPILGVIYDDSVNKTYIRVSSYYYYNSLGGTPLSNGQTTSFDVYYNPTEFKSTGTWVSSMRADSYGSRNRMTVQPQSTHQMHHAFNLSIPKDNAKTELRLIFDYSGSNTDLTASVHAVEGTVMLEGSRV
jgi:hypothetical protein